MTTKQELSALDRKLAFWQATDAEHKTDKRNAELVQDLLAALEQCLPILDAYRRISGGDGDISAMNARAAIAKARGQS